MKKFSNVTFIIFITLSFISLILQFCKIVKCYIFYSNIGYNYDEARNLSVLTIDNLIWIIITILLFLSSFVIMVLSEELEEVSSER